MAIIFVSMPLVGIARPSLALGILKAKLKHHGLRSQVMNGHLAFAEYIGLGDYRLLVQHYDEMLGDWIFSASAFDDQIHPSWEYIDRVYARSPLRAVFSAHVFRDKLFALREAATVFTRDLAQKIVDQNPAIVGCTSVFQQHVASLGLLREVRRRLPKAATLLGGANCEGIMGFTTHRLAPWIDYVISGEAEDVIVPLCRNLLDGDGGARYPPYVITPDARLRGTPRHATTYPRGRCHDLSSSPPPDFDDYFADLQRSPLRDVIRPVLLTESSRGCWWGEIEACTFCGLNGESMQYRTKRPEAIAQEWTGLVHRYRIGRIGNVDNIFDHGWFATLLPLLEAVNPRLDIFYETKANLKREQVQALRRAGVVSIQPGIESLSTPALRLMRKGNTAVHNIQLLKWCLEVGLEVRWGFLAGLPDEDDGWYADIAGWLDWLFHLQPPLGVMPIEYHRFSVYHRQAQRFGLRLRPLWAYKYIYPFEESVLSDQAYIFEDEAAAPADGPGLAKVRDLVRRWRSEFRFNLQALVLRQEGDELVVDDARSCRVADRHVLRGVMRDVYRLCDGASPRWRLAKNIRSCGAYCQDEIDGAINDLRAAKLLLELDGRLVALAVRQGEPYPYGGYAPYGRVVWDAPKPAVRP